MNDANKYINNYIEISTNALHEFLNQTLQLKTQLKLANEVIQEKDKVIGQLNSQSESIQNELSQELQEKLNTSNKTVEEKEKSLQLISNELQQARSSLAEVDQLRQKVNSLDESNAAMRNKISHMDTLTRQVNEMKNEVIRANEEVKKRDETIAVLTKTIEELNSQIIELNTKKTERSVTPKKKVANSKASSIVSDAETENDDF